MLKKGPNVYHISEPLWSIMGLHIIRVLQTASLLCSMEIRAANEARLCQLKGRLLEVLQKSCPCCARCWRAESLNTRGSRQKLIAALCDLAVVTATRCKSQDGEE